MIPPSAALRLQLAAIAGNEPTSSYLELRPLDRDGQPCERAFVPVRATDEALRRIYEIGPRLNVYVGAAPRVRESGRASDVERVWCLWADLDGPEALERLAKFRPLPSIVVRTGSPGHAHAYWPLRQPLAPEWARLANRRLALALGGDMAATDPSRVLRACSTSNLKTDPPRPVTCSRLELDMHTLPGVVRALPDDRDYTAHTRLPMPAVEHDGPLDGLARTVSEAQVGNRNAALFWAACRAAEHVADGELDAHEAHARLRDAALATGLTEHEVTATLRSATATAGVTA